jgi:hypothetical protein
MSNPCLLGTILCGLLAPLAPASAEGMSETYVGKGVNAAYLAKLKGVS